MFRSYVRDPSPQRQPLGEGYRRETGKSTPPETGCSRTREQGRRFRRRALLDWLDCRRSRWPTTANPHLLITQKTAVELGPAGKLWTTRDTRNLTATLERPRVDRQLEEALTHDADPLHLALVFGIDEKTAIRYPDSARALLGETAEQASQ
ncbi:hypothetical protein [Streptomyces sp. NPDC018000]|uniref:hypothetical protein n=1 Tax=Streptomyces sp. NPDC018000 TaxID=3365028 RepID=UPI003796E31B